MQFVGNCVSQLQIILQGSLAAVLVDDDALQQALHQLTAVGFLVTVGDQSGAAYLAEHTGHLGGELHFGTVAHLSVGARVGNRDLRLEI